MQLINHLEENNMQEIYQSAYRKCHSTETALLCIHNDIVVSLHKGLSVLLVLLDLSAAFDTIDHKILLNLLKNRIGVNDGQVLQWFRTYLKGRTQSVCINNSTSYPADLLCGVPQGYVLGPMLFTI